MEQCQHCGGIVPQGQSFCGNCGTPMIAKAVPIQPGNVPTIAFNPSIGAPPDSGYVYVPGSNPSYDMHSQQSGFNQIAGAQPNPVYFNAPQQNSQPSFGPQGAIPQYPPQSMPYAAPVKRGTAKQFLMLLVGFIVISFGIFMIILGVSQYTEGRGLMSGSSTSSSSFNDTKWTGADSTGNVSWTFNLHSGGKLDFSMTATGGEPTGGPGTWTESGSTVRMISGPLSFEAEVVGNRMNGTMHGKTSGTFPFSALKQ